MSNDYVESIAIEKTSRRGALTALGVGGAAALATLVSSKEAKAGHDATNVMHLGASNTVPAGSGTSITHDQEGVGLILDNSHSEGNAVHAHKPIGVFTNVDRDGIMVSNTNTGPLAGGITSTSHGNYGVEGEIVPGSSNENAAGVVGVSSTGPGAGYGEGAGVGVSGSSKTGTGVKGFCGGTGTAIDGDSVSGVGVRGMTNDATSIGVWALNALGGRALAVGGKAEFDTAGAGTIPAGQNSGFVSNGQVTSTSHITVTLTSDPGQRSLHWVERSPGSGFTVHLSPAAGGKKPQSSPETTLTYLIVEPPPPA